MPHNDRRVSDDNGLPGIAILYAILGVVMLTLSAVVAVFVFGEGDSTPVVVTIMGLSTPIVGVLLLLLQGKRIEQVVQATHDTVQLANGSVPAKIDAVKADTEAIKEVVEEIAP